MAVNDLNSVSKKGLNWKKIDENLDLFEHNIKINIYLTKLDENWDQKVILTNFYPIQLNNTLCKQFGI